MSRPRPHGSRPSGPKIDQTRLKDGFGELAGRDPDEDRRVRVLDLYGERDEARLCYQRFLDGRGRRFRELARDAEERLAGAAAGGEPRAQGKGGRRSSR